jgi:uncharacterized repeat protein (TIGR03803 family)
MNYKKYFGAASAALMIVIATLVLAPAAGAANKYRTLHKFTMRGRGAAHGVQPSSGVILDDAGNLYGTTVYGGRLTCASHRGCGVVFKLTRNPDGGWSEKVLYKFLGGSDGSGPSNLIFDATGNLYGTLYQSSPGQTSGGVFRLAPKPDGSWTESVLYAFTGGADGAYPSGLIFDGMGSLYGTTAGGGVYGYGTAFELTPKPDGSWTETVLYSFTDCAEGCVPRGGLIFDSAGTLYGTTPEGGADDHGSVFRLTPNPDGSWTENVLYSFTSHEDGDRPSGQLIFDAAGNLYSTTVYGGGDKQQGTVFKLSPNPDGSWTESVLYSFTGGADGYQPSAPLMFDAAGNLYGTTPWGGNLSSCNGNGCGTVFKLTPDPDGNWKEKVVHQFTFHPGGIPLGGVVSDAAGNLYGTTTNGVPPIRGTVFEITP